MPLPEACGTCHLFGAGGVSLIDNPFANAREEWRRSPVARWERQGRNCHMPDRRRRRRGIRDADMVGFSIEVTVSADRATYRPDDVLRAMGAGAGHAPSREAPETTRRSACTLYLKELPLT